MSFLTSSHKPLPSKHQPPKALSLQWSPGAWSGMEVRQDPGHISSGGSFHSCAAKQRLIQSPWSLGLLCLHLCCSRQEFGSDQCPDLTREVYLQDIHCVGSLCKLYFRELPNPLLTYELYEKFTVSVWVSIVVSGWDAQTSQGQFRH